MRHATLLLTLAVFIVAMATVLATDPAEHTGPKHTDASCATTHTTCSQACEGIESNVHHPLDECLAGCAAAQVRCGKNAAVEAHAFNVRRARRVRTKAATK